ncbi:2-dehydropantoate 2-reductase [Alkalimarinus sediminis]|uniref:2-dehydropantoate 2-reductase n=1 Tax=Alkalimarinus sediminis TaxID=1632866 RepID=A0A9E8KNI7_9ALTE|nr:2-dehydropantoate 2-reductase [Alkalimarinus sediminis]UZW73280.1 2-dehydropantoate 2-reductase [Alkalimarinus sediminis]
MAEQPTIHILGAGALGSLWAAQLSQQNHVILLVKPDTVDPAQSYRSFQFVDQNQTSTVTLPCEPSISHVKEEHLIETLLVFTKSYDTLNAVKQLAPRITPLTRIVLFQNGMGSQQEVTNLLPNNPIFAASTTEGANRPDKSRVIYAGKGETWLGSIGAQQPECELKSLSSLLASSGLKLTRTPDIWEKLWLKLAINCAINPYTALLDCNNGELIGQPLFDNSITLLCHELSQAMKISGIEKTADELQALVIDVINKTANNVSSMLQDVRAGKQTEIEYINGYIESLAHTHELSMPTNLWLLQQVRARY